VTAGAGAPRLAVAVVTYNRPAYLVDLLASLADQVDAPDFDVVIVDNGSAQDVRPSIEPVLRRFAGPVTVIREQRNSHGRLRLGQAAAATDADFVLVPGDDDLAEPHYIRAMADAIAAQPDATMVAGGMEAMDAEGRHISAWAQPHFASQPEAMAALLSYTRYSMPGCGFRRSAVDFTRAPLARASVDWWMWIQCWLSGPAAVTDRTVIRYRLHGGQEKSMYGAASPALDGARMLIDVVTSAEFTTMLASWSSDERAEFVADVLRGPGPMGGDSRWGAFIQLVVADRLARIELTPQVMALHAQASGHAGVPASPGQLASISPDVDVPTAATWSRVPVVLRDATGCVATRGWADALAIPDAEGDAPIRVTLACRCGGQPGAAHDVRVSGVRPDVDGHFAARVGPGVTPATLSWVLDEIGCLTGRAHGFEARDALEGRIATSLRRARASRIGRGLSPAYTRTLRWLERR
jgi:hypothetical protein